MAGDDLIEGYLDELGVRLRWQVGASDVLDELRDHLYSACEIDPLEPRSRADLQHLAVERLGSVDVVADAVLGAPGVRFARPTGFTRLGGVAALVAAAAWPVVGLAWMASILIERRSGGFGAAEQGWYVVGAGSLWLAGTATAVALAATCRRHGSGRIGAAVAVGCAAAAVTSTSLSWFVVAWAGLFAVAAGVMVRSAPVPVVSRAGCRALVGAWPMAGLAWLGLRLSEVGGRDAWGGYPLAVCGGVLVGSVVAASGCALLGRRLVGEPSSADSVTS